MFSIDQAGRLLIGIGLVLIVIGVFIVVAQKLPFLKRLGQLPGDIRYQSKDGKFVFFAPIVSSIIISLVLTIVINILVKIFRK